MRPDLSFSRWLRSQRRRDDPVGDLARDTIADDWRGLSPASLRLHLRERHPDASDAVREALGVAASEYFATLSERQAWTSEVVRDMISNAEAYRGMLPDELIDAVIAKRSK